MAAISAEAALRSSSELGQGLAGMAGAHRRPSVPHSGAGSLLRRRAALAAGVGPCSPLPVHDVSFVLCFTAEIMHVFLVSFHPSSTSSPSAGPDIPRRL